LSVICVDTSPTLGAIEPAGYVLVSECEGIGGKRAVDTGADEQPDVAQPMSAIRTASTQRIEDSCFGERSMSASDSRAGRLSEQQRSYRLQFPKNLWVSNLTRPEVV
jgi:hypothetical protein